MEDRRPGGTSQRPGSLRIIVNKPLVVRLTKDIIETYRVCKPTFTYSKSLNPKRYLTNPSTGVLNDGLDNLNSDYILAVNAALINSDFNRRYIVKDLLGQGTFGQVVKCWSIETNSFVAVKVIKNQPAYYHQARVEISILTKLMSFGDVNVYMNYCPVTTPPVNNQSHIVPGGSGLGEGPDTWQRTVQVPQWNALGVSPSSGMFRPISLGVSPSQFTPPSSQFQLSPGSPGRYGPTSPARGGIHGTALGKAAALGQYHKRRGLGTLGSLHLPSQENTMPHWQGHHHNNLIGSSDMGTDSYLDCNSQGGYLGSPCDGQGSSPLQPWRQRAGTGISTGSAISYDQKTSMPYCPAPKAALLSTTEMCSDGGEDNSPSSDPGDWDPNYSDELLFQEDVSDSHSPRSRVSGGIRSVQASSSTPSLVGGWGRAAHSYTQFQGNSTCNSNLYSTGVPGASGINSSIVFGNTATQLTRAGQRNEHPVNALPTSAHGRQDYRRIS